MAIVVVRQPSDTDDKLIGKFRKLMQLSNRVEFIKKQLTHLKPSAERNLRRQSKQKRRPLSSY